jgi:hypothetical protein
MDKTFPTHDVEHGRDQLAARPTDERFRRPRRGDNEFKDFKEFNDRGLDSAPAGDARAKLSPTRDVPRDVPAALSLEDADEGDAREQTLYGARFTAQAIHDALLAGGLPDAAAVPAARRPTPVPEPATVGRRGTTPSAHAATASSASSASSASAHAGFDSALDPLDLPMPYSPSVRPAPVFVRGGYSYTARIGDFLVLAWLLLMGVVICVAFMGR